MLGTDYTALWVAAAGTGTPLTRHAATAAALCQDASGARVWAGVHFRFADSAGDATGKRVAGWALDNGCLPGT